MKPEPMIGEEDVARALYDETLRDHIECGGQPLKTDWDTQPAVAKAFSYRVARAAISAHLAALERAGYRVVPIKPTAAMMKAWADDCYPDDEPRGADVWRLMIAAAPPPQNSDEVKP